MQISITVGYIIDNFLLACHGVNSFHFFKISGGKDQHLF